MLGLGLLPQGKVGLITFFAYSGQFAALVLDILQRTTAQDTILELLVVSLDIKVDTSIALVGEAIVENLLNQLLLFDNMTS